MVNVMFIGVENGTRELGSNSDWGGLHLLHTNALGEKYESISSCLSCVWNSKVNWILFFVGYQFRWTTLNSKPTAIVLVSWHLLTIAWENKIRR